jgi:hypothetical protein
MTRAVIFFFAFALLTSVAFAHHGWGSYDANKPLTVTGPPRRFGSERNTGPRGVATLKAAWQFTLAGANVSFPLAT